MVAECNEITSKAMMTVNKKPVAIGKVTTK